MNQPLPLLNLPIAVNPGAPIAPPGCVACAPGDGATFAAALQQAIQSLLGTDAASFPAPLSDAELERLTAGIAMPPATSGRVNSSAASIPEPTTLIPASLLAAFALTTPTVPIAPPNGGAPQPIHVELYDADYAQLLAAIAEPAAVVPATQSLPAPDSPTADALKSVDLVNLVREILPPFQRRQSTQPFLTKEVGETKSLTFEKRVAPDEFPAVAIPANSIKPPHFALSSPAEALLSSFAAKAPPLDAAASEKNTGQKSMFERSLAVEPLERRIPDSLVLTGVGVLAMPIMDEKAQGLTFKPGGNETPPLVAPPIDVPVRNESAGDASNEDQNAAALARSDRGEFVARMTDALQRAHAQMPKSLELDLHPPALGKVHISVVNQDGILTARIETPSDAVRSLLLDNLQILDRNLAEHGITLERMQVRHVPSSTPGQTSGGLAGQLGQGGGTQNRQPPRFRQHAWGQTADEQQPLPASSVLSIGALLAVAPGMDRMI